LPDSQVTAVAVDLNDFSGKLASLFSLAANAIRLAAIPYIRLCCDELRNRSIFSGELE
jgi:hypothetical protein